MSARDLALLNEDWAEARRLDWMRFANCRGTDLALWFPEKAGHTNAWITFSNLRREICRACTVSPECEQYAQEHRPHGIWNCRGDKARRKLRLRGMP